VLHPPGLAALLIGLSPRAGELAPLPIGPFVVSPFGPQHKYRPPHLLSQWCTLNLYASSSLNPLFHSPANAQRPQSLAPSRQQPPYASPHCFRALLPSSHHRRAQHPALYISTPSILSRLRNSAAVSNQALILSRVGFTGNLLSSQFRVGRQTTIMAASLYQSPRYGSSIAPHILPPTYQTLSWKHPSFRPWGIAPCLPAKVLNAYSVAWFTYRKKRRR